MPQIHEDFSQFPLEVHLVWDLGPDESVSQSSVSAAQQMHLGGSVELEGWSFDGRNFLHVFSKFTGGIRGAVTKELFERRWKHVWIYHQFFIHDIYIYIMYIRYICCIVRFSVTQNVFDRPFSTKL